MPVARRRHHAALARAADGNGPTAQCWIVALLHRGEKGIHVDVDNLAGTLEVDGHRVGEDLDLSFLEGAP